MSVLTSKALYRSAQTLSVILVPVAVLCLFVVNVEERVRVRGVVESADQIVVRSEASKLTVAAIHVEDGDAVEVGQLLVEFRDLHGIAQQQSRLEASLRHLRVRIRTLQPAADAPAGRPDAAGTDGEALLVAELARLDTRLEQQRARLQAMIPDADVDRLLGTAGTPGHIPADLRVGGQELEQKRARVTYFAAELERIAPLTAQGVLAASARDAAEHRLHDARLAVAAKQEELIERVRELIFGYRDTLAVQRVIRAQRSDRLQELEQEATQAEIALAGLATQRRRLRVAAPIAGRVVAVYTRYGEDVEIGKPLLALSGDKPKVIQCRVPESRFADVALGQEVLIKSDLYNYLRHEIYRGYVTGMSEHGIRDGERIYYELTVGITDGRDVLRVGSGAVCEIRVGRQPAFMLLVGGR